MYDKKVPYEEKECNHRIIREIAEDQNLPISLTEDIIQHTFNYVTDTIRSGSLEGVMIPYLGKFQVKAHSQQYRDYLHSLGKEMKGYFRNNKDAMKIIMDDQKPDECTND